MNEITARTVVRALDRLRALDLAQLRQEWQLLYKTTAPRFGRDLLVLGLEHRLQEQQLGGLKRATERALRTLAASERATKTGQRTPPLRLKPGARLLREWGGRVHSVTVVTDGYEYDGTVHKSLSTIARAITGAHWSGPRFFGLLNLPDAKQPAPTRHG